MKYYTDLYVPIFTRYLTCIYKMSERRNIANMRDVSDTDVKFTNDKIFAYFIVSEFVVFYFRSVFYREIKNKYHQRFFFPKKIYDPQVYRQINITDLVTFQT